MIFCVRTNAQETFDSALILSSGAEGETSMLVDSRSLATLLLIRDIQTHRHIESRPELSKAARAERGEGRKGEGDPAQSTVSVAVASPRCAGPLIPSSVLLAAPRELWGAVFRVCCRQTSLRLVSSDSCSAPHSNRSRKGGASPGRPPRGLGKCASTPRGGARSRGRSAA